MLAFGFFALIFSSFLWLMYSVVFVADTLNGISLFDAGATNVIIYILLVCAPIFLIWAVFGYVNQYIQNKQVSVQLRKLMEQLKKNQGYSDLIARALIEAEQQVKDGFALNKFDLLISDMNELLSEIIRGCKLASVEQIDALWAKVQNGGKWSFGKVIIEINNSQTDFKKRILDRSVSDFVLAGTIMEFCARYTSVVKMLEEHDQDRIFLEMVETGVMGKVYSILSPISLELQRGREAVTGFSPENDDETIPFSGFNSVSEAKVVVNSKPNKSYFSDKIFNKISLFGKKKTQEEISLPKDEFSMALERSFKDDGPKISLPIEAETDDLPKIEMAQAEETGTQRILSGLKEEWNNGFSNEFSLSNHKETDDLPKNIAYPFGNWSDEQNYQK